MVVITSGDEWTADFEFAGSLAIPRNFVRYFVRYFVRNSVWSLAAVADGANFCEWRRQSLARADLKFAVVGPMVHMRLQGGNGHDGSGFGHAPGVDHAHSELLEAAEKTFRSRRSGHDDPQAGRELPPARLSFQSINHAQPDCGNTSGQRDLFRRKQIKQPLGLKVRPGQHDFAAVHDRRVGPPPGVG